MLCFSRQPLSFLVLCLALPLAAAGSRAEEINPINTCEKSYHGSNAEYLHYALDCAGPDLEVRIPAASSPGTSGSRSKPWLPDHAVVEAVLPIRDTDQRITAYWIDGAKLNDDARKDLRAAAKPVALARRELAAGRDELEKQKGTLERHGRPEGLEIPGSLDAARFLKRQLEELGWLGELIARQKALGAVEEEAAKPGATEADGENLERARARLAAWEQRAPEGVEHPQSDQAAKARQRELEARYDHFVEDKASLEKAVEWLSLFIGQLEIEAEISEIEKKINNNIKPLTAQFTKIKARQINSFQRKTDGDDQIITLQSVGAGLWPPLREHYLFLFGQKVVDGVPTLEFASLKPVDLTPFNFSLLVCALVAIVLLVGLTFGLSSKRYRWFAGPAGRLSLSKVQIFFFTGVVVVVSVYVFLRTGMLGEMSEDVLLLLGIAGASGAAAAVGDRFTQRLDWDNWLWLVRRGWLERKPEYRLSHLVTDSAGNFDIFRMQAVLFSLLVGGYLIATGFSGLASVDLPDSVMGLLGLSQVTYIAGKAAGPPSVRDLNQQLKEYRKQSAASGGAPVHGALGDLEDAFRSVFGREPAPVIAADNAGLLIEFADDTEDLFPLDIKRDGALLARLPARQPFYRNDFLVPGKTTISIEPHVLTGPQPLGPDPCDVELEAERQVVMLAQKARLEHRKTKASS